MTDAPNADLIARMRSLQETHGFPSGSVYSEAADALERAQARIAELERKRPLFRYEGDGKVSMIRCEGCALARNDALEEALAMTKGASDLFTGAARGALIGLAGGLRALKEKLG